MCNTFGIHTVGIHLFAHSVANRATLAVVFDLLEEFDSAEEDSSSELMSDKMAFLDEETLGT